MNYVAQILVAIIGLRGSSQDPEKVSMRAEGVIALLIGLIVSLATAKGYIIPWTDAEVQAFSVQLWHVLDDLKGQD